MGRAGALRRFALALAVSGLLAGCPGEDDMDLAGGGATKKREPLRTAKQQVGPSAEELYKSTCATCHGPQGQGLPGLGKNLTTSQFVESQSLDDFVAFLKIGREAGHPENTTGIAMPPRGGNPALTDDQLRSIAQFVKDLPEVP